MRPRSDLYLMSCMHGFVAKEACVCERREPGRVFSVIDLVQMVHPLEAIRLLMSTML